MRDILDAIVKQKKLVKKSSIFNLVKKSDLKTKHKNQVKNKSRIKGRPR